jgi:hypothetical protein
MARGRIEFVPDVVTETGTTRWRRPWVLKVWRFGHWAVLGRYTTESGARMAAKRQRVVV